ncbi:hypothetical protein GCM10025771_09220 [Niveibacterium umoris]|uniref:Pilus assembly protein n=1 Tax=Niveibacterium umoris TaxID=1193620 RepID=A0A840BPX9_9RHOO|nr:hypothetical protein [Niveibacterium umoris]MBB4013529.1 hypothetical protein [Niveibacterium umoris]
MSRVRIDFAPAARLRPGPLAVIALLALALVTSVAAHRAWRQNAALQVQRAQVAAAAPAPAPVAPFTPPTAEQAEAVNDAITLLNLPWPALLDGLQSARPDDVALLRIEPRASQRTLRVVAESERADALFDFADALTKQAPFVKVKPVNQTRLDTPPRLQSTLDLEWQP